MEPKNEKNTSTQIVTESTSSTYKKTAKKLDEAYYALQEVAKDGGRVLFVGTKKQAQEAVKEEAIRGGQFWVNQRWLGGTLTNFKNNPSSYRSFRRVRNYGARWYF